MKIAFLQSKKDSKDQESIQSSTTPVPGYQWKSNKITINNTNASQEVSHFPLGDHKAAKHDKHKTFINNTNYPQKKYCLGTVSKNILLEA